MSGASLYFLPSDISAMLAGISAEERDRRLATGLTELAPRVAADRRSYRHFGPYWWWVKPLLARQPGARRSWLRGGYRDRTFLQRFAHLPAVGPATEAGVSGVPRGPGLPARPDQPDQSDPAEQTRWIAFLGLLYQEAERVDELPAGFHLVEDPQGGVTSYQAYDADASRQLELFSAAQEPSTELRHLLRDPRSFSASGWLRRAEGMVDRGRVWEAAAALRRAIDRAAEDEDRSRGWLLLGRLFQDRGHVHKAIFCYRNAFAREQEGWVQGLMAEAWMEAERPDEALPCYRRALQAMPGNPEYQAGRDRAQRLLRERSGGGSGYVLTQDRIAR